MNRHSILFVLLLCILVDSHKINRYRHNLRSDKKQNSPPYCTQVTKETNYPIVARFDYPTASIQPGQHEAYQQLFCLNPPKVNKAVTIVCDWSAPPQVQFTLGDEYMHVVRQDPTGRFLGNAIIQTYQYCSHKLLRNGTRSLADITVTEL